MREIEHQIELAEIAKLKTPAKLIGIGCELGVSITINRHSPVRG